MWGVDRIHKGTFPTRQKTIHRPSLEGQLVSAGEIAATVKFICPMKVVLEAASEIKTARSAHIGPSPHFEPTIQPPFSDHAYSNPTERLSPGSATHARPNLTRIRERCPRKRLVAGKLSAGKLPGTQESATMHAHMQLLHLEVSQMSSSGSNGEALYYFRTTANTHPGEVWLLAQ